MMLEQLQSVLATLVGGSCYPNMAAQDAVAPYIVYQRVVSVTNNNLQGPSSLQNTRVQIDVYAQTYASAQQIAASVRAAMQSANQVAVFTCIQLTEQDFYEFDVRLHRVSLEFSIWST